MRDVFRPKPPIRSAILLYLASLPPDQPVAWGQRIAAELRARKLATLSPNTVYPILKDFVSEGLVEKVSSDTPPPTTPTEALVSSASTDADRKRLETSRRLFRAGYTEGDLRELEERHRKRGGLAGLKPREVRGLVDTKKRTGFKTPDPRAIGYRLLQFGREVAELLKDPALLAVWWTCVEDPTDNELFVSELEKRGLGPAHVEAAERAGLLEKEEGEPAVRQERYIVREMAPEAISKSLLPRVVVKRRCRYVLT